MAPAPPRPAPPGPPPFHPSLLSSRPSLFTFPPLPPSLLLPPASLLSLFFLPLFLSPSMFPPVLPRCSTSLLPGTRNHVPIFLVAVGGWLLARLTPEGCSCGGGGAGMPDLGDAGRFLQPPDES